MALWVECPVINELRLDFGAFTCNILSSNFVRLSLTVHIQNYFFDKGQANQTGVNM
jgi:hypothetical protein